LWRRILPWAYTAWVFESEVKGGPVVGSAQVPNDAGLWNGYAEPSKLDFVLEECCRYSMIEDYTVELPESFEIVAPEDAPKNGTWVRLPSVVAPTAVMSRPQRVPLHIFATVRHRTVRRRLAVAIAMWVHLNPEYAFYILDDVDIDGWLEQQGERVREALRSLQKHLRETGNESLLGVHKADLWRILMLRQHGGVYVDVDVVPTRPLREFPIPDDAEAVELVRSLGTLHQDFIISAPGTCHLNTAVDLILDNFKRKYEHGDHKLHSVREFLFDDGHFKRLGGFIPLDLYAQRRVEQVSGPVVFHRALQMCVELGKVGPEVHFLRDDCGTCRSPLYQNDCSKCAFTSSYLGYKNDVRETYWGNLDTSVQSAEQRREQDSHRRGNG